MAIDKTVKAMTAEIPKNANVVRSIGRNIDLSTMSNLIVQGDNQSTTIYFMVDRHQDELDLVNFNFTIKGTNANNQLVVQVLDKVEVPNDDTKMAFRWIVSDNFTLVNGKIDITISAVDPTGITKWNSLKTSFKVAVGVNAAEYTDIAEQYLEMFNELVNQAGTSATNAQASAVEAYDSMVSATASAATATTKAGEANTSAINAKTSETNAKASENKSIEQAVIATTKAGEANVSAIAAEKSKTDAQAIKDSTEVFYKIDGDNITGYRVGFRRANEVNFTYSPKLQSTLVVGNVTKGIEAKITARGTLQNPIFDFVVPQGDKGSTGSTGATGATGATPAFSVGVVTSIPYGQPMTITITGTATNPILNVNMPEGKQGVQGIQGVQGVQGTRSTITIGEVVQLATGQIPYITNTGSETDAIFKIGLPAGAKGDKGEQGIKGDGINVAGSFSSFDQLVATYPTGDGSNSYFVGLDLYVWAGGRWENKGKLKGADGTNGIDGLSAFQIAVENGFTGTVAEWLYSLVGAQGAKGDRGFPAIINGISADPLTGEMELAYTDIVGLVTQLALKATLISPSFTDIPTTPTATEGDNSIQIANTLFVTRAIANSDKLTKEFVDELPPVEEAKANIIYMVAKTDVTQGDYRDEWILDTTSTPPKFEFLGTTKVDLSEYAKITQLPTKTSELTNDSDYTTKAILDTADAATLASSKSYTDTKVAAIPIPDVSGQIAAHNLSNVSHADIRSAVEAIPASTDSKIATHNTAVNTHNDIRTLIDTKVNAHNVLSTAHSTAMGLKADKTSLPKIQAVSIAASSFVADATYTGYGFRASISISGVTTADSGYIAFDVTSVDIAMLAEISSAIKIENNLVYLYAKKVPTATLIGTFVRIVA